MSARQGVWRTTREAEHAMLGLTVGRPESLWLATHFADGQVVVSVEERATVTVVASGLSAAATDRIREDHRARTGGRLVVFPGSDRLTGVITVREVLQESAIDVVTMVGQREPVAPDTRLDTQDFVRPTMADGRVELVVRPAPDGVVVPFEQPNPTPCCADHA